MAVRPLLFDTKLLYLRNLYNIQNKVFKPTQVLVSSPLVAISRYHLPPMTPPSLSVQRPPLENGFQKAALSADESCPLSRQPLPFHTAKAALRAAERAAFGKAPASFRPVDRQRDAAAARRLKKERMKTRPFGNYSLPLARVLWCCRRALHHVTSINKQICLLYTSDAADEL